VTWQDKRSQEVLDRLEADGRAESVRGRSGMPLDPYFSAGKLTWLLEHDEAVAKARDAGTLRLGTVDSFLCERLGAGFATAPSTASRTQLAVPGEPQWDPELLDAFGVPGDVLPALEDTAGDLGLASDPPALAALAAKAEDSGGVRVLPALAGLGAPWWRSDARAVLAGMTGGTGPGHIARAALEAIAWRVADVLAVVAEQAPVEALRVDGGLTRDPLLMQMQADAAGVPIEHGVVDATAAGAAALAAVGAGIWPSTLTIAERIPVGERVEPQRDAAWREEAHAEWRRFVERAAEL